MVNIFILVETEFFDIITGKESNGCIVSAYMKFVNEVVNLLNGGNDCNDVVAILTFTEAELQYFESSSTGAGPLIIYRKKARAFIRELRTNYVSVNTGHVRSSQVSGSGKVSAPGVSSPLHWTGYVTDLVELIYALQAIGCVNNGTITIKELGKEMYSFFDIEAKDCYRFYVDIRRRKNISKTCFLEKLLSALNERLQEDDEKERARK